MELLFDPKLVKCLRICTQCGKKFRTLHGLRVRCPTCSPPSTESQRKKYRDAKKDEKDRHARENRLKRLGR
jgi:predicted amidophosphoribosyltransferase